MGEAVAHGLYVGWAAIRTMARLEAVGQHADMHGTLNAYAESMHIHALLRPRAACGNCTPDAPQRQQQAALILSHLCVAAAHRDQAVAGGACRHGRGVHAGGQLKVAHHLQAVGVPHFDLIIVAACSRVGRWEEREARVISGVGEGASALLYLHA